MSLEKSKNFRLLYGMAKKALVIVESPSKAKTIQKYLGREYIVKASVGHIKDLPKSKLGVDPKKGFEPDYQVIPAKTKVIEELKKASKLVPVLYLATDPDREGEAIAWHIQEELKARGKKIHRVLFNAITKPAVIEAMGKPQSLDSDKYHAQQARRILDRLVGYKISPLLWDKVKRGISAGRVQSVALRLIVDREAEIKVFQPEEYWQIEGVFSKDGVEFSARYFKMDGKDPSLPNRETVDEILSNLKKADWKISSIEQKERTRKPTPPFITSRLQQEAARKLGFSAKKTMTIAQHLYEGVDLGDLGTTGLITYMRTDSVRIEPGALQSVRGYIEKQYGKDYLPAEPNIYKSRKSAQEAHEAIRPTTLDYTPEDVQKFLDKDEFRLYQLIWNRFVASQMTPAVYDQTAVDIVTKDKKGHNQQFRATGSVMKFAGFTAVYLEGHEDSDKGDTDSDNALKLPKIKEGDSVQNNELNPSQHFTQPPPRYTDASLIRDLEEKGIGRPSTYASILSNIQDREYVEKRDGKYFPSELGTVVTELLVASFPDILNSEFTAAMENQLDDIEEGNADWKKTLSKFWKPFEKTLETAKAQMKNVKRQEVPTDIECEKCGHKMVIKWGKLGSFLACSNYPDCKSTQDFKKDDQGKIVIIPKEFTDKKCAKCSKPMVVKSGKFGKFLACSDYPTCKSTQPITIGIHCPTCQVGEIAQKQSKYGRLFYSCNRWPECNFACWDKPIQKPCPQCQFPILTEKVTKRAGLMHKCSKKECGFVEIIDPNYGKTPPSEEGSPEVA
jgi:DNA topoisomerase-1